MAQRVAAAVMAGWLGVALADPWGLQGATGLMRDGRPPPPDWFQGGDAARSQGTDTWGSIPGAVGAGAGAPGPFGDSPTTEPVAPTARPGWGGRVAPAGSGPDGPAPWAQVPASGYRFRPDSVAPPAELNWPGESPDAGGATRGDYQFRAQSPLPRTDATTWPDLGGYRFRPLTERERTRQGPHESAGPAAAVPSPESGFGPWPGWAPAVPAGRPGDWAPR